MQPGERMLRWGRDDCVAAIARVGLPQPGKSACFFCPSSKKHEIITLALHLHGAGKACRADGAPRTRG